MQSQPTIKLNYSLLMINATFASCFSAVWNSPVQRSYGEFCSRSGSQDVRVFRHQWPPGGGGRSQSLGESE